MHFRVIAYPLPCKGFPGQSLSDLQAIEPQMNILTVVWLLHLCFHFSSLLTSLPLSPQMVQTHRTMVERILQSKYVSLHLTIYLLIDLLISYRNNTTLVGCFSTYNDLQIGTIQHWRSPVDLQWFCK